MTVFKPVSPVRILVLLIVALSFFPASAKSDSPSDKLSPEFDFLGIEEEIEFLQEETVSIAIQHEQPISEAPSNVYVITDEDIRQSGAIDLPTVLRRIPGMEVIQMTGADFNVSVRGDNQLRANKLLVLVDGRSIYLDIQGEVLWKAIPVTLPEIKKIEVLKGPASALYGFNAFDGIINIITKSPDEIEGTTIQVAGGEFGTFLSTAIHAGKHEKWGYRFSVGQDQTNQWDNRDGLAFRAYKFNGQVNYALTGDSNLTVSGGFLDSNQYDGPIVETLVINQEPSIGYANVGYERPDFFIRAWWTRYTQAAMTPVNPLISSVFSIFNSAGLPLNNIQANTTNIDSQHTINFENDNRLTYGFNYRHNQASSEFLVGDEREDRLGLFIQDEWKIFPTLTAVGGLRFDMDTFINPTYSPRFSLVFKPLPNHTFRTGYAVAFRSPTIFEEKTISFGRIILPPPLTPVDTTLVGSSNIGPEKIVSYDIGYQGWYWKHRIRTRLDIFFNHITDLIGTNTLFPGTSTFFNSGSSMPSGDSVDIYGGEAGVEFLAFPWLNGFANLSVQEIGQTFSTTNRVRRGAPRFKVNGGLRADFENGLNGEVTLYYVGPARYGIDRGFPQLSPSPPNSRVGSYVLVNLRAAYKFWKVERRNKAEVAVSLYNALNDKHKEHPLGETIGSRVMGWLTIRH